MSKESKRKDERIITIEAPKEEWEAVQRLITSYRNQSRFRSHHDPMIAHLKSFQERIATLLGQKPPDDYMI